MKKFLIAAAIGVTGVIALAGFGGHHGGFGHGEMDPQKAYKFLSFRVDGALDDIKATDAQRKAINAEKDQLFNEGLKLKDDQKVAHQAMVAQWNSANPDSATVHRVIDERFDAFRAFAHKAADAAIRIHNVLNPDQRAQLVSELHHGHD